MNYPKIFGIAFGVEGCWCEIGFVQRMRLKVSWVLSVWRLRVWGFLRRNILSTIIVSFDLGVAAGKKGAAHIKKKYDESLTRSRTLAASSISFSGLAIIDLLFATFGLFEVLEEVDAGRLSRGRDPRDFWRRVSAYAFCLRYFSIWSGTVSDWNHEEYERNAQGRQNAWVSIRKTYLLHVLRILNIRSQPAQLDPRIPQLFFPFLSLGLSLCPL